MERTIAVLCCFCIIYVTGAVVQGKIANFQEQDLIILPGEEMIDPHHDHNFKKDSHKDKFSLENANIRINETDLYENGHNAKENNERSFVIINQKFKSQRFDPRPLLQKSLFDETHQHFDAFSINGNINNEERLTLSPPSQNTNQVPNSYTYSYKISSSYFNPIPVLDSTHAKGEYVELLKRPLVRPITSINNERTKFSRRIQELLGAHDDGLQKSHVFNNDEDNALSRPNEDQQEIVNQFGISGSPAQNNQRKNIDSETLVQKKLVADNINTVPYKNLDENGKLDQRVRNTLRDELSEDERGNIYNCYNDNCKAVLNKHNKILNNGIKLGLRCLCEESFLRDRSGRQSTDNFKDKPLVYENSTELTASEEAVVEETIKLISMNDDFGNAIVNKKETMNQSVFL